MFEELNKILQGMQGEIKEPKEQANDHSFYKLYKTNMPSLFVGMNKMLKIKDFFL